MRSDNLGLVNFAIGLVNSVLNLPDGQVNFLWGGGRGENGRENGKGPAPRGKWTAISFCCKSHQKV